MPGLKSSASRASKPIDENRSVGFIPQLLQKVAAFSVAFVIIVRPCSASSDECDPTFGDDMLKWVRENAAETSARFVGYDYQSRAFNAMVLGYDQINKELVAVADALDVIGERTTTFENSLDESDKIRVAILRQADANNSVSELLHIMERLHRTSGERGRLMTVPDTTRFHLAGLQHVGVSTLLESFTRMGNAAETYLGPRYGIRVTVTFNTDGEYEETQFEVEGSSGYESTAVGATTSLAFHYSYLWWVVAAYYVYKLGEYISNDKTCQRRIEEQKGKIEKALKLLGEELPTFDEQYQAFRTRWKENVEQFAEFDSVAGKTIAELDERAMSLVGFQVERLAAAKTVLTAATVEQVRSQYSDGNPAYVALLNNVRAIRLARETGELRRLLQQKVANFARASDGLDNALATEELVDTAHYGLAVVDALKPITALESIRPLLERISREANSAILAASRPRVAKAGLDGARTCDAYGSARLQSALSTASLKTTYTRLFEPDASVALSQVTKAATEPSYVRSLNQGGQYLCSFVTEAGRVRSCEPSAAAGNRYADEFSGAYGNPMDDVTRGAGDGGYADDSRRVREKIEEVLANIEDRIALMSDRVWYAKRELPNWQEVNRSALSRTKNRSESRGIDERSDQTRFDQRNSPQIEAQRAALDAFSRESSGSLAADKALRDLGGAMLTLPSFPSENTPADVPHISGVSAPNLVFGAAADKESRLIVRERLKAANAVFRSPSEKALSNRLLGTAELFAESGSPLSENLVEQLLADAAALRFAAEGKISSPTLTIVDEGMKLSRKTLLAGDEVPADSLVARTERFVAETISADARAAQVRAKLSVAVDGYEQRRAALDLGEKLTDDARQEFFDGNLLEGESIVRMAHALVDIATTFTPGISWGRDIYEALTGSNLISGEKLSSVERTVAILGAVTVGIASKPAAVLKALSKLRHLGQSAEKAAAIIDGAQRIGSVGLRYSKHARDEMHAEEISEALVQQVLERGTRYWSIEPDSLVVHAAQIENKITVALDVYEPTKVITAYRGKFRAIRKDGTIEKVMLFDPIEP